MKASKLISCCEKSKFW